MKFLLALCKLQEITPQDFYKCILGNEVSTVYFVVLCTCGARGTCGTGFVVLLY
jgi:hypothetical protein